MTNAQFQKPPLAANQTPHPSGRGLGVTWPHLSLLALFCLPIWLSPGCAPRQSPPARIAEIQVAGDVEPAPDPESGVHSQEPPYNVPPEAMVREGVPRGRILEGRYSSRIYERAFDYWLYVPAQYRPNTRAALMVFQDGGQYYLGHDLQSRFATNVVLDNLIADGALPVMLALFVDPTSERSLEYDSLTDTYARFLVDELVRDVVTRHYSVTDDPEGWGIAGFSSGGIAAFTVAWHMPERFRRVLTHNGSFTAIARVRLHEPEGGDAYPARIRSEPRKPLSVVLLSGTQDLDHPEFGNWLEANRRMAEALQERGYRFRFLIGKGAHYPPEQAVADFPHSLRWLWRDYRPR